MEGAWPADIAALDRVDTGAGPALSCGAVVWRYRGELRLTLIAKATFEMVDGEPLFLRSPEEVIRRDCHLDNNPLRSVHDANDLAPYKARADVTFVGHAYSPPGNPTTAAAVRLALYRDTKIIERSLHVYGDRDPSGNVGLFERMALWPERALATVDNPIGARSPNVIDARDTTRAGSFAPISRLWPPRARLLRGTAHPNTESLCELPEDFDWGYFQSAPGEQQVAHLRGDEWIVLDGVHPSLPRLKSQLPSLRARSRVFATSSTGPGNGRALELVCDTLAIDGDRMTCAVGFRGSLPIENEEELQRLKILVGLEMNGHEIKWPPAETIGAPRSAAVLRARADAKLGDTRTLTNHAAVKPSSATPFGMGDTTAESSAPFLAGALEDDDSAGTTNVYTPGDAASVRERLSVSIVGAPDSAASTVDSFRATSSEMDALDGTFSLSAEESRALDEALISARPQPIPSPSALGPIAVPPPQYPTLEVDFGSTMDLSDADLRALGTRAPAPFVAPKPGAPSPAIAPPVAAAKRPPAQIVDEDSMEQRGAKTSILTPEQVLAALAGKGAALPFAAREPKEAALDGVDARAHVKMKLARFASFDDEDLSNADLSGLDFSGRSLLRCKLGGANLSNARFVGAKLVDAVLSGADLDSAIFDEADLAGADLSSAVLMNARFNGARLEGTNFSDAAGPGASFRSAAGRNTVFAKGDFGGAVFDEMSVHAADFTSASFARASFRGAKLTEALLVRVKAMGAFFDDAVLSRARADGAMLVDCSLVNVDATHASFNEANLVGARCDLGDFTSASFVSADLSSASFRDAKLVGTLLTHARMESTDFQGANLDRANVHGAARATAKLTHANVSNLIETPPNDLPPR